MPIFSLWRGRCGSADRFARDCHLVYQKTLDFGTSKGDGARSIMHASEDGEADVLAAEESAGNYATDSVLVGSDLLEESNTAIDHGLGNAPVENTILDNSEEAWNMQWRGESIYVTPTEPLLTAEIPIYHANPGLADEATAAIIDCGSSWSVVWGNMAENMGRIRVR